MKEIKLLNEVFEYITGDSKQYNSVQIIDKLIDIKFSLYHLEKLETPPTVDEVCDILSEDIGEVNVYFNKETNEFMWKDKYGTFYITESYGENYTIADVYLKPKSIRLLGQFYESLEEKNDVFSNK
jgi:hypothetical protein